MVWFLICFSSSELLNFSECSDTSKESVTCFGEANGGVTLIWFLPKARAQGRGTCKRERALSKKAATSGSLGSQNSLVSLSGFLILFCFNKLLTTAINTRTHFCTNPKIELMGRLFLRVPWFPFQVV